MDVLNKKWGVDIDSLHILTIDGEVVIYDIISDSDVMERELTEHYVSLHNKHIDDIMVLKMMRDKLCDTSGG